MDTTQPATDSNTQNPPAKKRYIRTFARDEATLKQGGFPDLVPFEDDAIEQQPATTPVAEAPEPQSPPPEVPQPKPVFRPQITPVFPQPPSGSSFTILGASVSKRSEEAPVASKESPPIEQVPVPPPAEVVVEVPPPTPPPVSPLPPEPEPVFFVPPPEPKPVPAYVPPPPPPQRPISIETYGGDFSDRVERQNASPLTVLAAEQDAGIRRPQPQEQRSAFRINVLYLSGGIVLLIAACVGGYGAYQNYAHKVAPVAVTPVAPAPIFVDERQMVSGTGTTLLNAVTTSVATPLSEGSVRLLYTMVGTTTDDNLFPELALPVPDIVLRNINPDGNMTGVINVDGSQSPFFILSVASYGDTFSGMLSWEPTMPNDLATLFPPYATSTEATSTAATSSPETVPGAFVLQNAFIDETIANHSVRAYLDTYGQIVLLYGYWNQSTLIIARDADAFSEIISRLANSEVQQ